MEGEALNIMYHLSGHIFKNYSNEIHTAHLHKNLENSANFVFFYFYVSQNQTI